MKLPVLLKKKGSMLMLMGLMTAFSYCTKSDDPHPPTNVRFMGSISVDGRARSFLVNLPPAYVDSSRIPLVVFLHGFGGNALQAEEDYGFTEKANSNHFAVLYPEGVQSSGPLGLRSWNAGTCCDFAEVNNINDVKFIDSLIIKLQQQYPKIDLKKVYVTGISNGGMMAYRLAADLGTKIAAIAPVAATMMYPTAAPATKMPILHIHAEPDTKVPFAGGQGLGGYNFAPVAQTLDRWASFNDCSNTITVISDDSKFKHSSYGDCGPLSPIHLYLTKDGGHSWPGGKVARPGADQSSTAFNATDLIWNFFKSYRLP